MWAIETLKQFQIARFYLAFVAHQLTTRNNIFCDIMSSHHELEEKNGIKPPPKPGANAMDSWSCCNLNKCSYEGFLGGNE